MCWTRGAQSLGKCDESWIALADLGGRGWVCFSAIKAILFAQFSLFSCFFGNILPNGRLASYFGVGAFDWEILDRALDSTRFGKEARMSKVAGQHYNSLPINSPARLKNQYSVFSHKNNSSCFNCSFSSNKIHKL